MIKYFSRFYQSLLFYLACKNKDWIKQLVLDKKKKQTPCESVSFAYSLAGMHLTVISLNYQGSGWRGNYAMAIACAATGDFTRATDIITKLCKEYGVSCFFKERLAKEIAPYMPDVALSLLSETRQAGLKTALLLKLNKKNNALELMRYCNTLDSLWYQLNVYNSSEAKCNVLNEIFYSFGMQSISLRNPKESLNVYNITSDVDNNILNGPLVSILVTTHCSEAFIGTALESLLNQTYKNIEVIVIDDASSDNTLEVVQKYILRDDRVKLVSLSNNQGTFLAKTEGLKFAKGEFITCHDSDDWAHPEKIELQIKPLLTNLQIVCTVSKWIRMTEDGEIYSRSVYPLMRLNPASPMFRVSVVDKVGVWEAVRVGADSEYFERIKLIYGDDSIYSVHKPLTIGSHRRGSLMTDQITGYDSSGISISRLRYWESWRRKHLDHLFESLKD